MSSCAADLAAAFTATQQPIRYAKKTTVEALIADASKRQRSGDNSWPIVADHLEENELADQKTLDTLRSAVGPLLLHKHASGKYVAQPKLTISDLRRINREQGGHYFSPDTMRFFGTQMERKVHQGPGGVFFVHSGDNFDRTARQWHVTRFHPETGMTDGHVHRSGDPEVDLNAVPFGELIPLPDDLPSATEAHAIAAHLAQHGVPPTEQPEQLQRQSQPIRYAKSKRNRVHPLLRGTRLAVVLKEIAKDKSRPETAAFAKGILFDQHGPTRFFQFASHLEDTDHPLLGHYNWHRISEKLLHDAATIDVVKRLAKASQAYQRTIGLEPSRLLHAANGVLMNARDTLNFGYGQTGDSPQSSGMQNRQTRTVIHDHLRSLFPDISLRDVSNSLDRVHDRINRRMTSEQSYGAWWKEHDKAGAMLPLSEEIEKFDDTHRRFGSNSGDPLAREVNHSRTRQQKEALRYERPVVGGVKNALRLMQSRNQQQYRSVAADVLKRLGLSPSKVRDGVTLSGAPVASVVAAIYHGGDSGKAEAAAAYFGHLMQLPSVTTFHADDSGSDSLYKLSLAMAPAAAAQHLQRHGVTRCVLVPNRTGTDVLIHDPGRRQADKVASAAQGGEVQETVGRSVRLGHADGHRADANSRRSYRQVISQFEEAANGSRQQPAADGNGSSPRAAADAAATAAARD